MFRKNDTNTSNLSTRQAFDLHSCWTSHSHVNRFMAGGYSKTSSWFQSRGINRVKEKTWNLRDLLHFLVEQEKGNKGGIRLGHKILLRAWLGLVEIKMLAPRISPQLRRCPGPCHMANDRSKDVQLRKQEPFDLCGANAWKLLPPFLFRGDLFQDIPALGRGWPPASP